MSVQRLLESERQMIEWTVSAQVDGGRRVREIVIAPEDASPLYVLGRLVARHSPPSKVGFWVAHNKQSRAWIATKGHPVVRENPSAPESSARWIRKVHGID